MDDFPLIKGISAVEESPLRSGTQSKPAALQVTMDSVRGTSLRVFLTVEAARQLQAGLAKTLQALDSR